MNSSLPAAACDDSPLGMNTMTDIYFACGADGGSVDKQAKKTDIQKKISHLFKCFIFNGERASFFSQADKQGATSWLPVWDRLKKQHQIELGQFTK